VRQRKNSEDINLSYNFDKEYEEDILKNHLPGFKIDKSPYLREQFKNIIDNTLSIEGQ